MRRISPPTNNAVRDSILRCDNAWFSCLFFTTPIGIKKLSLNVVAVETSWVSFWRWGALNCNSVNLSALLGNFYSFFSSSRPFHIYLQIKSSIPVSIFVQIWIPAVVFIFYCWILWASDQLKRGQHFRSPSDHVQRHTSIYSSNAKSSKPGPCVICTRFRDSSYHTATTRYCFFYFDELFEFQWDPKNIRNMTQTTQRNQFALSWKDSCFWKDKLPLAEKIPLPEPAELSLSCWMVWIL